MMARLDNQKPVLGNRSSRCFTLLAAAVLLAGCKSPPKEQETAVPSAQAAEVGTSATVSPAVPEIQPQAAQPPAVVNDFGFVDPPKDGSELSRNVFDKNKHLVLKLPVAARRGIFQNVELFVNGESAGQLVAPDFKAELSFESDGKQTIELKGLDASNQEKQATSFSIVVVSGCMGQLQDEKVAFRPSAPLKGVVDPVYVGPEVNGVAFRYRTAKTPGPILVACEFVKRLKELAALVKSYGLDEIVHLGTYNYREMRNPTCIARGDCALSQHSFGTALDIHALGRTKAKQVYSTQEDWVITPPPTCPGSAQDPEDKLLHEIACKMFSQKVFSMVLTPNLNALHRDHFHVDTTHGAQVKADALGLDPTDSEYWDD